MSAAINGSFNLADVRDLAAGTIAAADRGHQGECYILGNDAVSFKDFSRIVSEESGCKIVGFFLGQQGTGLHPPPLPGNHTRPNPLAKI